MDSGDLSENIICNPDMGTLHRVVLLLPPMVKTFQASSWVPCHSQLASEITSQRAANLRYGIRISLEPLFSYKVVYIFTVGRNCAVQYGSYQSPVAI